MNQLIATLDRVRAALDRAGDKIAACASLGDASRAMTLADAAKIDGAAIKLAQFVRAREAGSSDESGAVDLRHKLRTPINHILGFCELMLEEAEELPEADWRDDLEAIQGFARDLVPLVDAILEADTARSADAPRPTRRESSAPMPLSPTPTATLLVVDDNPDNREVLARRLRSSGAHVLEAADGRAALKYARNVVIDLVLLDIVMPVMDGYETLAAFKADPELRAIPIIMLSSLDQPESITRCIELGAEDHLPKPFDPVLLRARIGACLEKKTLHDRERSHKNQLVLEKQRADALLNVVIPLGVALSGERDLDRLLERIVRETQSLCHAEGGALFLRRADDRLRLVLALCARVPDLPRGGGDLGEDIPVDSADLVAEATREGTRVALDDAAALPRDAAVVGWIRRFDQCHGHRTRSVLAVALPDPAAAVVGVLLLWNARDPGDGQYVPFDANLQDLVESMSSLAGVALAGYSRESALRDRIAALEIQVDESKRNRDVAQITETDYFRSLRSRARKLRQRGR